MTLCHKKAGEKPVILLGSGGHAKVLIETLKQLNRKIIGLVDPGKEKGSEFRGITILGDDDVIIKYSTTEVELVNGVGSVPDKNIRWKLEREIKEKGYKFSSVIHPSAVIANDVLIEEGVQIMAGVIIQPGTRIGGSSIINTGVIIDHDCYIHEDCHLAPGVTLSGNVIVGKGTHIGTGTSVIHDIEIGSECIIGAGSVIHKDVASKLLYIQSRELPLRENK